MGNNGIGITCLLVIWTICCLFNTASASDRCPLPSALKSNYDFKWSSKPTEWTNLTATTSYLQFVLSWTPSFCESLPEAVRNKEFQCTNAQDFDLVVHGLWPQAAKAKSVRHHPRNCRNEQQLDTTFIKRYYCLMPDEDLIQSEWEKHGTCHYKTAADYYSTVERLYKSLTIPNIKSIQIHTAANIKTEFMLNNPKLFSSAIQVSMNTQNRLRQIVICYNLNYQFTSCSA